MKRSSLCLIVIFLFSISCTTKVPVKTYRNDVSALASTDIHLPIPSPDDDYEDHEMLMAAEDSAEVEENNEELFLEGVAIPEYYAEKEAKTYVLKDAGKRTLDQSFFDFPVVYNQQVEKWVTYFTTRGRKYFELYIQRAGRYAPVIGKILEENELPRDLIFLAMAESGFNNHARSHARAVGPWQFMPATGKSYSLNQNWYVDERRDPIKATKAAAQYLNKLYDDFGDWEIATAAYNAGEGKLGRAIKKYKTNDFWRLIKGKYLKSETKNYVPKIMALAIIGKNLKAFGFKDLDFHAPLTYEEVQVSPMTDIYKVAENLQVDPNEIKRLNPELLRWFTPPDKKDYKLRIPLNSRLTITDCCQATEFQTFKVPKKMSLSQISKKFRIKHSYVLAHLNQVPHNASLKKGDVLRLPFRPGEKVVASNVYYMDLFEKPRAKKNKVRYHLVKRGESLYSIAKKHKTSVKRIIAYNSSARGGIIFPGKKLVIR
nr:lytic transglycosylase domain-containing protein [Bacteriovorax sp. HI3]